MYGRRNRPTSSVDTADDKCPLSDDKPAVSDFVDPLHDLDDSTKETFRVSCRIHKVVRDGSAEFTVL